jgi:hypothetical protein
MNLIDLLCSLSVVGALTGIAGYVYGYIIKSRGDRRLHTAGLLFTSLALAALPLVLRDGAEGGRLFSGALLVAFLIVAIACQSVTALRGRRSDRRAADRAVAAPSDPQTNKAQAA